MMHIAIEDRQKLWQTKCNIETTKHEKNTITARRSVRHDVPDQQPQQNSLQGSERCQRRSMQGLDTMIRRLHVTASGVSQVGD